MECKISKDSLGTRLTKAGIGESPVGQVVKDLALSLLWGSFNPWPRNFCMLQACPPPPNKQTETQEEYEQVQTKHVIKRLRIRRR